MNFLSPAPLPCENWERLVAKEKKFNSKIKLREEKACSYSPVFSKIYAVFIVGCIYYHP